MKETDNTLIEWNDICEKEKGTKADCMRKTGISRPTLLKILRGEEVNFNLVIKVRKYFNRIINNS
jgi:hypothetical protein